MRSIVHIPTWSPADYDLNDLSNAVVSRALKERLANPESTVGTRLWHNGYVLEVTDDNVTDDTRTLTCQVVDDDGPTTREWMLYD